MKDICFQKAAQQEIEIYYPNFYVKRSSNKALRVTVHMSIEFSGKKIQNRWKIKNEKDLSMHKPNNHIIQSQCISQSFFQLAPHQSE